MIVPNTLYYGDNLAVFVLARPDEGRKGRR
jgi:hypothetical protein